MKFCFYKLLFLSVHSSEPVTEITYLQTQNNEMKRRTHMYYDLFIPTQFMRHNQLISAQLIRPISFNKRAKRSPTVSQGQDMFTDCTSLKKISLCSVVVSSRFPISTFSSTFSHSSDTFKHLQTQKAIAVAAKRYLYPKQCKNTHYSLKLNSYSFLLLLYTYSRR